MKVCIIGNSHVACINKAILGYKNTQVTFDFFASYASSMVETQYVDNRLEATSQQVRDSWKITSKGMTAIDFDAYDWIWVHGVSRSLAFARIILSESSQIPISEAVKHNALVNNSRLSYALLAKMPLPLRSKCIVSAQPNRANRWQEAADSIDREYPDLANELISSHKALGFYQHLIQPKQSLRSIDATATFYNENALGLGRNPSQSGFQIANDKSAGSHMNEKYGTLMLEAFLTQIEK